MSVMTEEGLLVDRLAALDEAAVLRLLNFAHLLHVGEVAEEYGITDQSDIDQLAAEPDRSSMLRLAADEIGPRLERTRR